MDDVLYRLLAARAGGLCECGCGRRVPPGEADHFFGRAKVEEQEFNCWILHPWCHQQKTLNAPSWDYWALRFIAHCGRYMRRAQLPGLDEHMDAAKAERRVLEVDGYAHWALECQKKREWQAAKKGVQLT
jgi:hypothetical protein